MSLKEVILEIVDEMEKDAGDYKKSNADMSPGMVLLWARQLRRVCKAAGDSPGAKQLMQEFLDSPVPKIKPARMPQPVEPSDDDLDDVLRGHVSIPCVGGASNGDMIVLSLTTPRDGSYKYVLENEVYILKEDGRLHFSATETLARIKGPKPSQS